MALLVGCGRVGFDAQRVDPTGQTILFEDSFEDGVIDPEWSLLRFEFSESDGRLQSTPTVRPGFNYGHSGNGRGAIAALGIGDPRWIDVRVEWTQQSLASVPIVDPGLQPCEHTPSVRFRIESLTESWNEPEATHLGWSIEQGCGGSQATGMWGTGEHS